MNISNSNKSNFTCNSSNFAEFQNNLTTYLTSYIDNFHKVKYFQINVNIT